MKKILKRIISILNRNPKKIITNIAIFGFFFFIVIYGVYKTRLISMGVNLTISGIENGQIYDEGMLEITGNAKRARHVLINGREITIDQNGDFTDFLILSPGYNIITVSAEDKFSKITKKVFEVVRKEI